MIETIKEQIKYSEEIEILDELKNQRNTALKYGLSFKDLKLAVREQVRYLFYDNLVSKFEKYLKEREV